MPRTEAVTLLGSLVCFPRIAPDLPTLQPNASQLAVMRLPDVKVSVTERYLPLSLTIELFQE
jgi:hypothetical protein